MKRKSRNRHIRSGKPRPEPQAAHSPAAAHAPLPPVPEELKGLVAGIMLSPEMKAAYSMHPMMDGSLVEAGINPRTVAGLLQEQGAAVAEGDLAHVRRSLAAQAAALEQMFHYLFRCATVAQKHSQDLFERYMRLALRAQTQAMRTQTALGRLCQEPGRKAPAATKVEPSASPPAKFSAPPSSRPAAVPHPVARDGFRSRPPTGPRVPAGSDRLNGLSAPKR